MKRVQARQAAETLSQKETKAEMKEGREGREGGRNGEREGGKEGRERKGEREGRKGGKKGGSVVSCLITPSGLHIRRNTCSCTLTYRNRYTHRYCHEQQ